MADKFETTRQQIIKDEAQAAYDQRPRIALAPGEANGQNTPAWPDKEVRLTDVFGSRVWPCRKR